MHMTFFLQIVTLKDKTFVLQYDYYAIQYYFKPLLLNTKYILLSKQIIPSMC